MTRASRSRQTRNCDNQNDRETETDRERERERQTDRERERERERGKEITTTKYSRGIYPREKREGEKGSLTFFIIFPRWKQAVESLL